MLKMTEDAKSEEKQSNHSKFQCLGQLSRVQSSGEHKRQVGNEENPIVELLQKPILQKAILQNA